MAAKGSHVLAEVVVQWVFLYGVLSQRPCCQNFRHNRLELLVAVVVVEVMVA